MRAKPWWLEHRPRGIFNLGAAAADLNFDRDVLADDRYFILQNGARRACDVCAP